MSDRRYPEPYTPDACSILTAAAYGLPIDDEARERFTEAADVAWMEARQTRYFDVAQGAYLDFIEGREDARATLYHLSDKDVLAVVATHLCEEPHDRLAPEAHAEWSRRLRQLACAALVCVSAAEQRERA